MSLPQSVADTNLGLTAAEIQLFRHQQQIAAQGHAAQSQAGRGRGQSRSSNPGSRAASAASSQGGQGRVFLDHGSLERLHDHFERLMDMIQERIEVLDDQVQRSVQSSSNRVANAVHNADVEMARMDRILAELDSYDERFKQVRRICSVIKDLRRRVDDADRRMDQRIAYNHTQAARRR